MGRAERKARRREKLLQRMERRLARRRQIRLHAQDILDSYNFKRSEQFMQHGSVSVRRHCLRVAECSVLLEEKLRRLGIRCQERELVRGALLHDYFLYDWHEPAGRPIPRLHGFFHPGIALANADREYVLTPRERDIIKKHMWPLTPVPPACREAWIVTAADKYCSFVETVRGGRGRGR